MNLVIQPHGDRDAVKKSVCAFIDGLPVDRPWLVDITKLVKKRTNLQNRALWGVAYKTIAEVTGYKPDDVHDLMCGEYWGWTHDTVFGKKKRKPIRTTTHDEEGKRQVISREELAEYYLFIQSWCSPHGVDVPDPDPEWFVK